MQLDTDHTDSAIQRFREFFALSDAQGGTVEDMEARCAAFYEAHGFREEFRKDLFVQALQVSTSQGAPHVDAYSFGLGALLALMVVMEAYDLDDGEPLNDDDIRAALRL